MNIPQFMQMVQQVSNNPQMLLRKFGIPEDLKSPDDVAQYLINNGRITQAQLDQTNAMYKQFFKR